jgi:EAL domain-containing protein (putative c-di-GMP-specific phosphodiesterase class I)
MSILRVQDRGYRVGGDELALIMPDTDTAGAINALERLRTSVVKAVRGPTISVGVSTSGPGQMRPETIRDHADAALYEAKRRGKNQVVAYEPDLGGGSDATSARASAMRRVLETGDIAMWFQPIFKLAAPGLLAFEALLRLPHEPEIEGPREAFAIAHLMGRSLELDMLCISKALDAAHDLPPGTKLFLNIEATSLVSSEFSPDEILALVAAHAIDPGNVVFEITDATVAPTSRIAQQVDALRERGFGIALDDAGSGHAGLEMMRLIRFDYVKIDRSVILDAAKGGPGRAVILAVAAFAREAGAFMIAEGVETTEMLESIKFDEAGLRQFWIQGVQGYLLGEPTASMRGVKPPPGLRTSVNAA